MRLNALVITLLAIGCASAAGCASYDYPDYLERRAIVECRQMSVCERGHFESEYNDMSDCESDFARALDDDEDVRFDDCKYIADEGAACVSRIRRMSCEDYAENDVEAACDLVWDCR